MAIYSTGMHSNYWDYDEEAGPVRGGLELVYTSASLTDTGTGNKWQTHFEEGALKSMGEEQAHYYYTVTTTVNEMQAEICQCGKDFKHKFLQ